MADARTSVGHSINLSREDVLRALKSIARERLLEKSPGLHLDSLDWQERAEVGLPAEITSIEVTLTKA